MNNTNFFLPRLLDTEDKKCSFKNRIRKNYQHIKKWAKRTKTNCFRIYDRDIKEHPVAIDYYNGRFCVHVYSFSKQEETIPKKIEEEVTQTLISLFDCLPTQIYWKTRLKRDKTQQYEKISSSNDFFIVQEYGVFFKINLTDYLDSGLFLDHRETRQIVAKASKNKHVLNLFSYTCSFSIHAALHGAAYTKSVDMSNTYTAWGRENFLLNSIDLKTNEIIREDCLKFLDKERLSRNRYDIIIIDPPTLSRSKKMEDFFDIHQDYEQMIRKALLLLSSDGCIYFSTNSRKFRLDETLFSDCRVENISSRTIPIDFHDPKIHYCWKISIKKLF
ncbi:MAG: SAM-dependent methyltransferase [Chlamydiae bacterium]|nr:SAM-dependent methyltransferase [Chlamydiota bacterium]